VRRNTAPAICLAAMVLRKRFGGGVMHVMPADHLIKPRAAFMRALKYGARLAEDGYLVTYGIRPDRPETGYGYIRVGRTIGISDRNRSYEGAGFTEKPGAARARYYVRSRQYLWNSGIFTFRIDTLLDEIEQFIPEVHTGIAKFTAQGRVRFFERVPDISIDYGVMEKSRRLCVVEGRFSWDDVGSWLALERYFKLDREKNVLVGDVRGIEVAGSIMLSHDVPLRAYDVRGMIVVASRQGVLVCSKKRAQDLKKLLK
jgi:mannose-1-phosphate guanylyltransferase